MGSGAFTRAAAGLALISLLAACSAGTSTAGHPTAPGSTSTSPVPAAASYVALGDSFTAGPGLARQRTDAGFCQRSDHNWPSLLAKVIHVDDVTDLSCAGASTADLMSTLASPAMGPETNLVTVSVGGNDGGLFVSLLGACSGGDTCESFTSDRAPDILKQTGPRITELLEAAQRKAPRARVVLVGYPRIMPGSGTCSVATVPPADSGSVVDVEAALDSTLAQAARRASVEYVSLRSPSRGHDACAGPDAWTNGGSAESGDGIAFHPRRRGMEAIAQIIAQVIARA